MKKIKYIGIVVVLLGTFLLVQGGKKDSLVDKNNSFIGPSTPPPTDIVPSTPIPEKIESISGDEVNGPKLQVVVSNDSYTVSVFPGDTVLSVLERLSKTNKDFSFSGEEYPGIGFFVDEINGVKNSSGLFWVYYLNDVSATLGVSKQKVSEGDEIRWEQRVPGDY